MSQTQSPTIGLEVRAPVPDQFSEVLSLDTLHFVEKLVREFDSPRDDLLRQRAERQRDIDAGEFPDFRPDTRAFARANGRWRPSRPTCGIGGWRSRGRRTGR